MSYEEGRIKNMLFGDEMEPVKEGPVEIGFERSEQGRIKLTVSIDFGKTSLEPSKAAAILTSIVNILRASLDVKLRKFK